MSCFEFRPKFVVTEPMTVAEMSELCGKSAHTLHFRLEKCKGKKLIDGKKWTTETCMCVLNDKSDISNWHIEGYLYLEEVSDRLGVQASTVHAWLKKYHFGFIRQKIADFGTVWIKESDVAEIERTVASQVNLIRTKYMTSKQVAELCDVDREYVNVYAARLGIPKEKILGKWCFKKETVPPLVAEINRAHAERAKDNGVSLALRRRHPLVKDMRCFDENWFPRAMPDWMMEW